MGQDSAGPLTTMCPVKDIAKCDEAALTQGVREGCRKGHFHSIAPVRAALWDGERDGLLRA